MANVTGWTGSESLTGTTTTDSVAGFGGGDTISALAGNDSLYGGAGNDSVLAGDGNDLVYGDRDIAGTWGYRVYNRDFTSANGQAFTIESGTLVGSGLTTGFDVANLALAARGTTGNPEDFGIIFTATFTATTAGSYRFATTSDDGSTLRLFDASGAPLTFNNALGGSLSYMNNDRHQSPATSFGDVTLAAGQSYTIEIRYWENLGGNVLGATVTPPGGTTAISLANSSFIGNPAAGNTGYDTLVGGNGNDSIFGEAGNDRLLGDAGTDVLEGGDGLDSLFGGADSDTLRGDAGNDSLEGGDASDSLFGGTGVDTLRGDAGDDRLEGGADSDSLFGGTGADTLLGEAGTDRLEGGDDADSLFGGDSADTLIGDAGTDRLEGGADSDSLFGGTGADTLLGEAGTDRLEGGDDADSLFGGDNADMLLGDAGDDRLEGGAGSDSLFGGTGNDTLWGGDGADFLDGGAGNDAFIGSIGATVDGNTNAGDNDVLDLTAWGKDRTNILRDPTNPETGIVEFLDAFGTVIGTMSFTEIETTIPCFTPGSLVCTDKGEVAVENLRPGDMVLTRDHGFQPLRWAGRRDLQVIDLFLTEALRPILIRKGALGPDLPNRDMMVSPQHRMLLTGARAEIFFGEDEVLVAALHLLGQPGVERAFPNGISYLHLLFDGHEILCVDGVWTESLQPGCQVVAAMEPQAQDEIARLFPELGGGASFNANAYSSARRTLRAHEAKVLLAA